jgi:hypothetical protein
MINNPNAVEELYVHCPNCPDQGWYAVRSKPKPIYHYSSIEDDWVFDGYEESCEQEQCEFCWTVENSYFNKARKE